eukprot:5112534-Pyramimonas_sp.AAC.1
MTARRSSAGVSSVNLRATWKRVARAISAIRSMAVGCANGWLQPPPRKTMEETKEAWTASSPLQRKITSDIWDLHAIRASWGNINDGK